MDIPDRVEPVIQTAILAAHTELGQRAAGERADAPAHTDEGHAPRSSGYQDVVEALNASSQPVTTVRLLPPIDPDPKIEDIANGDPPA